MTQQIQLCIYNLNHESAKLSMNIVYNGYTTICWDSCYLASLGLCPLDLNRMSHSKYRCITLVTYI